MKALDRSSLVILMLALLSLLAASVFSPRASVEANSQAQSEYVGGDSISGWLLRLAGAASDQAAAAQPTRPPACQALANPFIF